MADLLEHIKQAKHNEACARLLLAQDAQYYDWAITATFYCAVHLVEACFTTRSEIGHTETARGDIEAHRFRQDRIQKLAPTALFFYKRLRTASSNLRYLEDTTEKLKKAYSEAVAKRFLEELPQFRETLESTFGVKLS